VGVRGGSGWVWRAGRVVAVPSDAELVSICHTVVDAVAGAVAKVEDWAPAGPRRGQYAIDLVADAAALGVLDRPGIGVLSEESGLHRAGSPLMAVIDPIDGSTNAAHGIPWYATSICMVDEAGPRVAVVANQASGERYEAVRGGGARRDAMAVVPSAVTEMGRAVVALSGYPSRHLGWAQFRAFGAAALDLCSVADGRVDAFAVCGGAHLAPWDYLGGILVCREAGAAITEANGDELVVLTHGARRAPIAAGTAELGGELAALVGGQAPRPGGGSAGVGRSPDRVPPP